MNKVTEKELSRKKQSEARHERLVVAAEKQSTAVDRQADATQLVSEEVRALVDVVERLSDTINDSMTEIRPFIKWLGGAPTKRYRRAKRGKRRDKFGRGWLR